MLAVLAATLMVAAEEHHLVVLSHPQMPAVL